MTFHGKSGNVFWHEILDCTSHMNYSNFSHKQHIYELSTWWDNDLTHHISVYQPLCVGRESILMRRGLDCLIVIPTVCCLKTFCGTVSPEMVQYSPPAVYKCNIDCNGHWPIPLFPQIAGLKSDNAQSSSSALFIPRLYAAITMGCWIFCFHFPFIHLFALPIACTPGISFHCNNRIVIPFCNFNVVVTLEIKRFSFIFSSFCDIS